MDNPNFSKDYFINPDGLKLFRIIYKPITGNVKAVLFLTHGLFEHCQASYYESIIKPLNDIGCMVISHDHIGHGLSEGERGIVSDFDSLVRDVLLDIDSVVKTLEEVSIFIYGHSMGGLISVCATLQRRNFFAGLCLEAPLLTFPSKLSRVTVYMGKFINLIYPQFPMLKLNCDDFSSDLEYLEKVKSDNLRIHDSIPAKTIITLYDAVENKKAFFRELSTPFIIGHGDKDVLCEIEGSQQLVKEASVQDKTLITYLNGKHQLRNEAFGINKKFSKDIVDWIKARINS